MKHLFLALLLLIVPPARADFAPTAMGVTPPAYGSIAVSGGFSGNFSGVAPSCSGQAVSLGGKWQILCTTFTISGCSATGATGSGNAGRYTSGTAGACTVSITLNGATGATASNGWACSANDLTTPADIITQTASTATTATLSGTTASGDVVNFHCLPY